MERAMTQVQSRGVLEEESHPSTSAVSAARQVELRAWAVRHGSKKEVTGKAPDVVRVSFGSLRSLQENLRNMLMRLSNRKGTIIEVQKDKQRTSAEEAIIPKASKGAQQLKVTGKGNGCTKGCRNTQMQWSCAGGGHCRVCQGLKAPRWRLLGNVVLSSSR